MITDTIKYWCDRHDKILILEKTQLSDFEQMFMHPLDYKACKHLINRGLEDCNVIIVHLIEIYFFEFNKILAIEKELEIAKEAINTRDKIITIYKSKT